MARKAAGRANSETGSFRGLVRELIETRGYVKASQIKEALAQVDAKQYGTLRPSQETTIYQVLKDLGHGRGARTQSRPPGPPSTPGIAALIESADPDELRRQLNELKERRDKLNRAIRALELLLGEDT